MDLETYADVTVVEQDGKHTVTIGSVMYHEQARMPGQAALNAVTRHAGNSMNHDLPVEVKLITQHTSNSWWYRVKFWRRVETLNLY